MSHWNPSSSGWERHHADTGADDTDPGRPAAAPPDPAGAGFGRAGTLPAGGGAGPGQGGGSPRPGERPGWEGRQADWEGQQPGWEGQQPGWEGLAGGWEGRQPGWDDGGLPLYSAPPAAGPGQQPAQPDPYGQPPIWSGQPPPGAQPPPLWEDQQPPKAYLWQQPEPPGPGRRSRAIAVSLAVIVALAAGGVVLGLELRSQSGRSAAPARHASSGQRPPATAPPATAPPVTPTASQPSPPPRPRPSPHTGVAVAPGVANDPGAPRVVSFLTQYFGAINAHDYQAFRLLLDAQMQQVETAQRFSVGFASTRDSAATLTGLTSAPDGRLAATVTFTSHQLPSDSPDQASCSHWTITLYLESTGDSYVIGTPPATYQASHQAC